jgi:hypothetical protein
MRSARLRLHLAKLMSPGHNSIQVVACAAFAEGRRVGDVALADISEVL